MSGLKPYLSAERRALIWRRSSRRRFEDAPARHAETVVLIGISGEAHYYIDGRTIRILPRCVLLAHPGQAHFLLSEKAETDLFVAVISSALIEDGDALPPIREMPPFARLDATRFEVVRTLSDELVDTSGRAALECGMCWWFFRIREMLRDTVAEPTLDLHPSVSAAVELIREDPSRQIADIAKACGMTHTGLGQIFRRELGVTPAEYRTRRRLELFSELRNREPDASLIRLAFDAGFGDYSAFYRACRKHTGKPPLRARENTQSSV